MKNEVIKKIALIEEFDASFRLTILGLSEIQKLNQTNTFYHLPFQLVSQGFERLMKAYICCAYFNIKKEYPSISYLRHSLGHDLNKQLDEILNNYFVKHSMRQFINDYDFLTTNINFKNLLTIISEFGKYARYYNFDIIVGNEKSVFDCNNEFENLKSKIVHEKNIDLQRFGSVNTADVNDALSEIYQEIVVMIEKFISALIRQINFGFIGPLAKSFVIGNYFQTGALFEGDFGKNDYRVCKI